MKIYKTLMPEMRKILKHYLDSGKKTPDEIRHNMMEQFFVEHQDEIIPILEANDTIRQANKENGTNIPYVPFVLKPSVSEIPLEHTLEYEMDYFIKQWEKKHGK